MFQYLKKLFVDNTYARKPDNFFNTKVPMELEPAYPAYIIEAGDNFLKYVEDNPLHVVLDSDSLAEAQQKIAHNNEIKDKLPNYTIPSEKMMVYETELRQRNYFYFEHTQDFDWTRKRYNMFWSYVNKKTLLDNRLYGEWGEATRNNAESQNSTENIIKYFKEKHGINLSRSENKFTVISTK